MANNLSGAQFPQVNLMPKQLRPNPEVTEKYDISGTPPVLEGLKPKTWTASKLPPKGTARPTYKAYMPRRQVVTAQPKGQGRKFTEADAVTALPFAERPQGYISHTVDASSPKEPVVDINYIRVQEEHQRKGLATEMLKNVAGRNIGAQFQTYGFTDEGDRFREKTSRELGIDIIDTGEEYD